MPNVTLVLVKPNGDAASLLLELSDTLLAEAVAAALRQPILEALQVRWSGEAFYIMLGDGFALPDDMEDAKTDSRFGRGDIVVYGQGKELVLAYGEVHMNDRGTRLECYPIGRVAESDLDTLEETGNRIHREGVRAVGLA